MLTEAALASDNNIWNDRGADDFLRYMKHDFFCCVYLLTHTLMTTYSLLNNDQGYNEFGERCSGDMRYSLAMLFFVRLNQLATMGYGLTRGESIPKLRSHSSAFTIYSKYFLWLLMIGAVATVYFSKTNSNDYEGQNLISKIWINIECIGLIVFIPYWYFTIEVQA